ncbi:likeous-pairing protein 2-like [Holothuria leucospilota]|uniref:Homologous-pairing protein 2 homolog n=1 Tax=Holothuria leucospilota TaxID=206669 RepID=A0A9Q1BFC9_HOLLE|nr:likeous-pairing protein 2-like [Holothuria leucospilota]
MSKSKEANAASAILDYLNKQNRPYSAGDIFNNLHKEFGKTLVVRTLEDLAKNEKIVEKVYGKQKIYVADQSQLPDVDEKELLEMDRKINELKENLSTSISSCKTMERELNSLNSELTTEAAQEALQTLTKECERKQQKLKGITEATNHVTPEEKDRIYSNYNKYVKEWRKRKRLATDILDAILEGYPKKKKDLFEEIGIETDEEYNVKLPERT